ncbi:MAG: YdbL family protein [Sneathiella sp.]|nr:YdbL family protein [Sneathiella sp.]
MRTRKREQKFSRRMILSGLFAAAVIFGGLTASPARADQLNDLRASGAVGEAFDGFARARDASAKGFVDGVNEKRRQIYVKRAKSENVSVDQVGRVYAAQILQKAPKGTWFLGEDGKWTQK